MRGYRQFMVTVLSIISCCLLPLSASAKPINLYESPADNAKVIGSVELSSGIIPIFTPKDGAWMKVGDPKNGNTGWIKNSELKDSQGNPVIISQQVSEGNNGKTQSMEMTYGKPMTPEQKKMLQDQLIKQQQNAAQSLMVIQKSLEDVQQIYKQQVDNMQRLGFPVVPGMGTTPANPQNSTNNKQ